MGFFSSGNTLSWEDLKAHLKYVREHGLLQFLNLWNRNKARLNDPLLWGDEIEYLIVTVDPVNKTVKLDLSANELLLKLIEEEVAMEKEGKTFEVSFKPEYGRFQIEVTPGFPYQGTLDSLLLVERNMKLRREKLCGRLPKNSIPLTFTHFPLMGVGEFAQPTYPPRGPDANSMFTPDQIINMHRRFGTLTKNIRLRRGSNVAINMPLYMDVNTKPLIYDANWWAKENGLDPAKVDPNSIPAKNNHVYCDSMAFGMGMCCLQVTFQLPDIKQARILYDQFIPLTPIMLALTAATPILRGYLLDTDVRWNIISAAVDDRTKEELEGKSKYGVIDKSRYASVSSYLSTADPRYNDVPLVIDEDYKKMLLEAGVDDILAQHIAHLFIRDPLVVYDERIKIDDQKETDHFENIQSTNWQTVRFKPPPPHLEHVIGWRVEFRPMEINFTDFENAAHAAFISLLMRIIREYNLNFYMPLSKVDQNMERAHQRGAVLKQKFWFRTNITESGPPDLHELSIKEIMHGSPAFVGLLPLIRKYLSQYAGSLEKSQRDTLEDYLRLVAERSDGTTKTNAEWIRDFVMQHPSYKGDSIVSQEILFDLVETVEKMNKGQLKVAKL